MPYRLTLCFSEFSGSIHARPEPVKDELVVRQAHHERSLYSRLVHGTLECHHDSPCCVVARPPDRATGDAPAAPDHRVRCASRRCRAQGVRGGRALGRAGHKVKFVAMTNGDVGHFETAGGPLARRRKAEVEECAQHPRDRDRGARHPRRRADADAREPRDDHPADSRVAGRRRASATGRTTITPTIATPASWRTTAFLVVAPFFRPTRRRGSQSRCSSTPRTTSSKPYPFNADVVVSIDETAERKWSCVAAMPSQFADRDSWQGRTRPNVPQGDRERQTYLLDLVKTAERDGCGASIATVWSRSTARSAGEKVKYGRSVRALSVPAGSRPPRSSRSCFRRSIEIATYAIHTSCVDCGHPSRRNLESADRRARARWLTYGSWRSIPVTSTRRSCRKRCMQASRTA